MKLYTGNVSFKATPLVGRALPGVVVVEMCPRGDSYGLVELPETVKNQLRLDVAEVVLSGDARFPVGGRYYVRWDMGTCVEGLSGGEVRFYGRARSTENPKSFVYDASKALVCDMDFNPTGKNIVIERKPLESFIEQVKPEYDTVCTVVKVGDGCEHVSPGDKVVVLENVIKTLGFREWEHHYLIEERDVYAVVE